MVNPEKATAPQQNFSPYAYDVNYKLIKNKKTT